MDDFPVLSHKGVKEIIRSKGTVILRCGCRGNQYGTQGADFQDAEYGRGLRLHNVMKNGKSRCTVCGTVK